MPLSGDKNPTRGLVPLLDWKGALFPPEGRVIVWTEWLKGIRRKGVEATSRPISLVQIYNILPLPHPRKRHRVPQTAG